MTIPSDNNRNDEIGNGATDTYNYTFKITSESDIKVSQRDTDDVETVLTLNVDYTVTGVGALNGGSIVLTAGNLTTAYHLTIRRDSALTQLTDVRNQGDFFPEVHEDTFDHLAAVSLTQQSVIDRCVKVSETYPDVSVELPGPQAGKVLKWNDAGTALINVDTGDAQIAVPADDSVTPAKIQSGLPFVFPETLVLKRGSDVASGSALPVINDGNYVDVTGSNAITSIDSIGIGTWLLIQFDAALTLTHSAVNLFLCAGGSNIVTAAGDHALFVEYGIGTWRCAGYFKANGQPVVLTGITFTNPVLAAATLNTSVAGTAFQDDDSFGSAASDKFASSESIKNYVDTNTPSHDHDGGDGDPIPVTGLLGYTAGDFWVAQLDTEENLAPPPSDWLMKEVQIQHQGTLRIKFDLKDVGAGSAVAAIFRNGVQVGTTRTVGDENYATFSQDIAGWSAGDLCQLYILTSATTTSYVKNFRLYSGGYCSVKTLDA